MFDFLILVKPRRVFFVSEYSALYGVYVVHWHTDAASKISRSLPTVVAIVAMYN